MMVSLCGLWAPTWPSHALPITILLVLLTSILGLTYLSLQRFNPKEPPIVHPWPPVPYLGHLIRMALQGGHYIRTLGLSHPTLPIFTLVVPFSRLYVVTSPSLAAAIQRKPTRQLDFNALLPDVVQRVLGLDDETRAIVERGIQSSGGGGQMGFLEELHGMLTGYLGPGKRLEDLTLKSAKELSEELDGYVDSVLTQEGEARRRVLGVRRRQALCAGRTGRRGSVPDRPQPYLHRGIARDQHGRHRQVGAELPVCGHRQHRHDDVLDLAARLLRRSAPGYCSV